ncbi:MAG TPA: DUF2227 family putative metal-binding protein [Anaerolineaceae bacterium]|nr:DUF2227 family putative metal-binding protein [Anaerolineaceae bacterium]HPN51961.1 DUF2227 family putative metal-binding protein [Anaerolineaceae bacterium]
MAKGTSHATVSLVLAGSVQVLPFVTQFTMQQTVPFSIGALLGIFLTPDLDLVGGSISQRQVKRQAGNIIGTLWCALWYPYARLLGHRSWLSHTPFIGTLFRVVYMFLVPMAIWSLLWYTGVVDAAPPVPALGIPDPAVLWGFLGLCASDCLHWLMDR